MKGRQSLLMAEWHNACDSVGCRAPHARSQLLPMWLLMYSDVPSNGSSNWDASDLMQHSSSFVGNFSGPDIEHCPNLIPGLVLLYSSCSSAMQQQMAVLAYLGSQCTQFMQLSRCADCYVISFGAVYLAWCDFAMDPTKEQHQIVCKSLKKCDEDPGND
jgi:hypothetical protein